MKEETFLIRTSGGPLDGESRVVQQSVLGWPPPVNLPGVFHGGIYIRQSFSKLPDTVSDMGIMRGADYTWMEDSVFTT